MEKYAIFGAGVYGVSALEKIGKQNVMCFIDNDPKKQGTFISGVRIISFEDFLNSEEKCQIVIASLQTESIKKQLEKHGITDYSFFYNASHKYYETEELIFDPYSVVGEASSEEEFNNSSRMQFLRRTVYDMTETLYHKQELFDHIEVETINRCNGNCSFCPANRKSDTRIKRVMDEDLFKSIVSQLEALDYRGRFTTFSNNEPLLDERIVELNMYARKHLPNARMHLFTNGTLLTIEKFVQLTDVLDELIIDNYTQDLHLIKPCKEIAEYCEKHPDLKKKVTIVLRKPDEILNSRSGNSPNRNNIGDYSDDRCILPFKQIIVRPSGEVSLCCNDVLGEYTLGDLNNESLTDVWFGDKFEEVRRCLYEGRKNWGNCAKCDCFSLG